MTCPATCRAGGTTNFYFSSPLHFLPGLGAGWQLDALRRRFAVLATGSGRWEDPGESWRLAGVLGAKGVRIESMTGAPAWTTTAHRGAPCCRSTSPSSLDGAGPRRSGRPAPPMATAITFVGRGCSRQGLSGARAATVPRVDPMQHGEDGLKMTSEPATRNSTLPSQAVGRSAAFSAHGATASLITDLLGKLLQLTTDDDPLLANPCSSTACARTTRSRRPQRVSRAAADQRAPAARPGTHHRCARARRGGRRGPHGRTRPMGSVRACRDGGGRWLGGPGLEISLEDGHAAYDVAAATNSRAT